jgi:hypothetical protein
MLKSATDEGRAMNRSTVFPDDFLIALRALI